MRIRSFFLFGAFFAWVCSSASLLIYGEAYMKLKKKDLFEKKQKKIPPIFECYHCTFDLISLLSTGENQRSSLKLPTWFFELLWVFATCEQLLGVSKQLLTLTCTKHHRHFSAFTICRFCWFHCSFFQALTW